MTLDLYYYFNSTKDWLIKNFYSLFYPLDLSNIFIINHIRFHGQQNQSSSFNSILDIKNSVFTKQKILRIFYKLVKIVK